MIVVPGVSLKPSARASVSLPLALHAMMPRVRFVLFSAALHGAAAATFVGAMRTERAPKSDPAPAANLTGGGIEIESLERRAERAAEQEDEALQNPVTTNREDKREGVAASAPHRSSRGSSRSQRSMSAPEPPAAEPLVFGAIGEPSALDLTASFVRVLPQFASAVPSWASEPVGDAGHALVTLELSPEGRLANHRIEGTATAATRESLRRTLLSLSPRLFTSRSLVVRLRVDARVSPDDTHDGYHGDVFALGAAPSSTGGSAFFALAIGRRVDFDVQHAR